MFPCIVVERMHGTDEQRIDLAENFLSFPESLCQKTLQRWEHPSELLQVDMVKLVKKSFGVFMKGIHVESSRILVVTEERSSSLYHEKSISKKEFKSLGLQGA